jgi:hypothetical protein
LVLRGGSRELRAEIKIAANALRVRAIKQEQFLGKSQIERAFEFTATSHSVRPEKSERSHKGFEVRISLGQAPGGSDPFLFLQ